VSALQLELALRTGLSTSDIARIASTAPKRYKTYPIAKRTGGVRTIAQPSRELKALQRVIVDLALSKFPVHEAAAAYESGRSISDNAHAHSGARSIMKLDFRDFFSSIKTADFVALMDQRNTPFSSSDRSLLLRLLFWGKGGHDPVCLSIGAPSSPKISNIIMYDIDRLASAYCAQIGVTYTRYADDVTVSGNTIEKLNSFERIFRDIVSRAPYPRLRFNNKKRGVYVRGQRQMVTGLILKPEGGVSIGRERKRLISSMIHRATLGTLTIQDLTKLRGLLGFAQDCDPSFVQSMRKKYGDAVIDSILRSEA